LIDQALVLCFAAGRSFTGEAVVELQLHGSPAVMRAVLAELGQVPGLRMAEPGEFARRALENGRLDLAEVEGLADLIDAETEAQRRQAVRMLAGALGRLAEGWRTRMLRAAALVEATIDFVDEDVPVDVMPEVVDLLAQVGREMRREVDGVAAAERVRAGFEVAIIGAPNVGKSTLLNALAGWEAAITSAVAGTTRDVIEVRMEIAGLPVTLLDTAGLRETEDEVELIGIARARARAERADLRVHLTEDGLPANDLWVEGDLLVWSKADMRQGRGLAVSGRTGAGLDDLVGAISGRLLPMVGHVGVAVRERHRVAIITALEHLDLVAGHSIWDADLLAEDIRRAVRAVDSLVGRIDVEDILGEIFSRFCIGK
jgi:tRNA modification GTPase